jgi:CubicO group peptidase (beta-lactamase class C family)
LTVDAKGTPFAGGGLSAGLRDLGRIGQLLLNGGEINGQRLFPASVVQGIRAGGDREAFAKAGYKALQGGSYRGMWWVLHNAHGAFAARGVHGQTIYLDPTAEMVIVRLSSFPTAKNAKIDPTSLPAYQAVAEYLMSFRRPDPIRDHPGLGIHPVRDRNARANGWHTDGSAPEHAEGGSFHLPWQ